VTDPTPSPTPLEIAEQGVDESVSRFIGRLHEQIRTLTAQVEKLQCERIDIVNRVMARERELSHFYDELGEPDLDSAVACIRSLLAAEAENAKLRAALELIEECGDAHDAPVARRALDRLGDNQ
jgi:hypothetical protein